MWYEYDIGHPSQKDIVRVRRLLQEVATAAAVPWHHGGVYSPEPIAVYIGDDVELLAVVEHGDLRILLRRDHSATPSFTRTKDLLDHAVAQTFGSRAVAQPPVVPRTVIAY